MDFEQILWGNKKFSDLLKDIYTNSKSKEKQIKDLVDTLKPLVTDVQTALTIMPLITNNINTSVKNDEQLVKLAGIVQRLLNNNAEGGAGNIISDAEREQLFAAAQNIGAQIGGPIESEEETTE